MHITKQKNPVEKVAYYMIPATWHFKRWNYRDNEKISGCHEFGGMEVRDEWVKHRGFLGNGNYSV